MIYDEFIGIGRKAGNRTCKCIYIDKSQRKMEMKKNILLVLKRKNVTLNVNLRQTRFGKNRILIARSYNNNPISTRFETFTKLKVIQNMSQICSFTRSIRKKGFRLWCSKFSRTSHKKGWQCKRKFTWIHSLRKKQLKDPKNRQFNSKTDWTKGWKGIPVKLSLGQKITSRILDGDSKQKMA